MFNCNHEAFNNLIVTNQTWRRFCLRIYEQYSSSPYFRVGVLLRLSRRILWDVRTQFLAWQTLYMVSVETSAKMNNQHMNDRLSWGLSWDNCSAKWGIWDVRYGHGNNIDKKMDRNPTASKRWKNVKGISSFQPQPRRQCPTVCFLRNSHPCPPQPRLQIHAQLHSKCCSE